MAHQIKGDAIYQFPAAVIVLLSSCIAYKFRFNSYSLAPNYLAIALALTLLCLSLLVINGFYQKTKQKGFMTLLSESFKAMIIASTLIALFLYLTKSGSEFSRIWMVYTVIIASGLLAILRFFLNLLSRNSYNRKNIVLFGEGTSANTVAATLESRLNSYLKLSTKIGFSNTQRQQSLNMAVDYIESVRNTDNAVSEIWMTADIYSEFTHIELEAAFSGSSVRLVYIPMVPKLGFDFEIEDIEGVPTINSELSGPNRMKTIAKWCEDFFLSALGAISLLPIFAIIAILVKLDSKGPVFYKQQRYGINGREISVWKFRTMHVTERSNEFKQATSNDPRITRVGHFLRKSSLDELPQLFNVLNGSMSLVGPRPHPNLLNEEYRSSIDSYMHRHNVKPGITGLAQVNGARGETPTVEKMQERINYDLDYVNNWSVGLDIEILIRTLWHVVLHAKK